MLESLNKVTESLKNRFFKRKGLNRETIPYRRIGSAQSGQLGVQLSQIQRGGEWGLGH